MGTTEIRCYTRWKMYLGHAHSKAEATSWTWSYHRPIIEHITRTPDHFIHRCQMRIVHVDVHLNVWPRATPWPICVRWHQWEESVITVSTERSRVCALVPSGRGKNQRYKQRKEIDCSLSISQDTKCCLLLIMQESCYIVGMILKPNNSFRRWP